MIYCVLWLYIAKKLTLWQKSSRYKYIRWTMLLLIVITLNRLILRADRCIFIWERKNIIYPKTLTEIYRTMKEVQWSQCYMILTSAFSILYSSKVDLLCPNMHTETFHTILFIKIYSSIGKACKWSAVHNNIYFINKRC